MPRTLKRRSDAISGNDNDDDSSPSNSPERPTQRRRRSPSLSSSPSLSRSASPSQDPTQTQLETNTPTLIKKLVRLALSAEYARLPLRRSDITQKILKDNNASHKHFKAVFAGAQTTLARVFGMTLLELPSREKTTLKDRRAQTQTQTQKAQAAGNKAWILTSMLPAKYKRDSGICAPARVGLGESEAEYTALYSFVVSLVYLNGGVVTDAKLERYLKRVNADNVTPVGVTDKLLARMFKEGYIEKRRDTSSGEEVVEWVVGPRGKIEVGVSGVADLVKGVYGFGVKKRGEEEGTEEEERGGQVKIEEEELNRRLERSLGIKIAEAEDEIEGQEQTQHQSPVEDEDDAAEEVAEQPQRGRGRPRRNQ